MKIFIVILNWNGKKDTLECLESLKNLEPGNFELEIIVVDNASTDGSKMEINQRFPEVVLQENKENLGFAEGNNTGTRKALTRGVDYILILNNDTLADKNLLKELLDVLEKDKTIGMASPKIYFAPGFEYHHDRYQDKERGKVLWYAGGGLDWQNMLATHRGVDEVDRGQYDKTEETDFATGCAMMVRREVFEKIGLFDAKYFLYWEDIDLCQRARKAGFKIFYVPRAVLSHKNASSSDKPGSKLHQYYQTRNRLLFGQRFASTRTKLALTREAFKDIIKGGIKREANLDFFLGRFGGKNNL